MSVDNFFKAKRALVTGAGQGLGRGVVKALCDRGAHVFAFDSNQEKLTTLADECENIETRAIDLSKWDETRAMVTGLGHIDLVVNNVGVTNPAPFLDATKEQIDQIFNTNLMTVVNISQVAARGMVSRGNGGSIVNVCSLATRVPLPQVSMYSASKAAIERLTKAMAKELGPHKIRVNSIHPVLMNTPAAAYIYNDPVLEKYFLDKIALARFAEIDDVVKPILFLLDDTNAAMVTGHSLYVDGGYD